MKLEISFNSKMPKHIALFLSFIFLFTAMIQRVPAQTGGPVYIVQAGDTLAFIASRFNVSLNELVAANPTIDPNFLNPGQQIVIPGLEGVTGVLQTEVISFGDTFRYLSRRTQVPDAQLIKLNRLVSPTELYVGISLIVPVQEGQNQYTGRTSAGVGESLFELAIKQGSDPAATAEKSDADKQLRFFKYEDLLTDFYGSTVMVRRSLLQESPQAVRGLLPAFTRGLRGAILQPDAAMDALTKRDPKADRAIDKARFQNTLDGEMAHPEGQRIGIGDFDEGRLATHIVQMVEGRKLKRVPGIFEVYNRDYLPPINERITSLGKG